MTTEPKRKRGLSHLGIGLIGLVVVLLLVVVGMNGWARARLETRLAPLRKAGEPTSIQELAPQPIPEADNAAAHLVAARSLLEAFESDYDAFFQMPWGEEYSQRRDQGTPPTAEQIAEIEAILAPHDELLTKVRRAAECEAYASLLDFSVDPQRFNAQLIESTPRVRTAARLTAWQIEVSVAHGDVDTAVTTGTDVLRLARLYDNEPTLVHFLTATACRQIATNQLNHALRRGPVSEDVVARLSEELDRHNGPARFAAALREERALGLDALSQMSGNAIVNAVAWPLADWQTELVDFYEGPLAAAKLPWSTGQANLAASVSDDTPTVVALLLPSVEAAYKASNRDVAQQRCLRILIELGRYRDRHGREASGLVDLKLPPDETLNPFTGQPLVVERTDKGWHIGPTASDDPTTEDQRAWELSP